MKSLHFLLIFLLFSASIFGMEEVLPVGVGPRQDQSNEENLLDAFYHRPSNVILDSTYFYVPKYLCPGIPKQSVVGLKREVEVLILQMLIGFNICKEKQHALHKYFNEEVKKVCETLTLFDALEVLKALKLCNFPSDYVLSFASYMRDAHKDALQEVHSTKSIEVFISLVEQKCRMRVFPFDGNNTSYQLLDREPVSLKKQALAQASPFQVVWLRFFPLEAGRNALEINDLPVYKKFLPKGFVHKNFFWCPEDSAGLVNQGRIIFEVQHLLGMAKVDNELKNKLTMSLMKLLYEYRFCELFNEPFIRCYPSLYELLESFSAKQFAYGESVDTFLDDNVTVVIDVLSSLGCHELVKFLQESQNHFAPNILLKAIRYLTTRAPIVNECFKKCLAGFCHNYSQYKAKSNTYMVNFAGEVSLAFIDPLREAQAGLFSVKTGPEAMEALSLNDAYFSFKKLAEIFGIPHLSGFVKSLSEKFMPLPHESTIQELERHIASWEKLTSVKRTWLTPTVLKKMCCALAAKHKCGLMEDLYKTLARENYRSVADVDQQLLQKMIVPSEDDQALSARLSMLDQYGAYLRRQLVPEPEYKRKTALTFLRTYRSYALQQGVLDERSWLDLELFCGQKAHPAAYIAARIPTFTELGHVFLLQQIANCTADFDKLDLTQKRLRWLTESGKLEQLSTIFDQLKEAETGVFSFWDNEDWIERLTDEVVFNCFGLDKKWKGAKNLADKLNSSKVMLEIADRWKQATTIIGAPIGILGAIISSVLLPGTGEVTSQAVAISVNGAGLGKTLPELVTTFGEQVVFLACFRVCLRIKLMHLARYFAAVDELRSILVAMREDVRGLVAQESEREEVGERWEAQAEPGVFDSFIERLEYEKSQELKNLREMLKAETFQGDDSFPQKSLEALKIFGYSSGRIIAAFNDIRNNKNKLLPVLSAVAELDILVSSCKLLESGKQPRADLLVFNDMTNTYCLPTFVKEQDPCIFIEGSWNPHLGVSPVITNDLQMGLGQPRNVVINGPNAGGKSSIMKGMLIAVILAQSIGIAPARKLTFTPFSVIRAYLNITDDQAGGNSLFMSAVNRAFDVYKEVRTLPPSQFSLTVFDELFNGTSSAEGEAAARTLINFIGKEARNICMITTHFKELMTLETERPDLFVNYKVSVDERGAKLTYPFKLERGISDQCIAFNILEEKGFDKMFVDECKGVLERKKEKNN